MVKIAVIGAGISGLTLAGVLKNYAEVTVFEKEASVGGRITTHSAQDFIFDHGAQFFLARSKTFIDHIQPWIKQGVIAPWHATFAEIQDHTITTTRRWDETIPHYVGIPHMHALSEFLSKDMDIRFNHAVHSLSQEKKWHIHSNDNDIGPFDWVISTLPPALSIPLLPQDCSFHSAISSIKMSACCALLLGFNTPLPLIFDTALVRESDISWISANHTKPQRNSAYSLTVLSTNRWANAHLHDDTPSMLTHLIDTTSKVTGHDIDTACYRSLHLWPYANITKQHGAQYLIDPHMQIAACGDWCIQGRIESACLSALALAQSCITLL